MNSFLIKKRVSLFLSLLVIIVLAFFQVNFARAGGIGPNQGFDSVTLGWGQEAEFATTQATPIGTHTVGVMSIWNRELIAEFKPVIDGKTGFWTIVLIGTGGDYFVRRDEPVPQWLDIGLGVIGSDSGDFPWVDIDPVFSFGLAITTVYITSPVSAADPFKYSIKMDTLAHRNAF
jgi:hypothetical protein